LSKYKLVVIDIDGTLLIRADEISAANKAVLAELNRRGVAVSLCTGRATPAARSVLNQLNLDGYHIFFDGALVFNPKTKDHIHVRAIDNRLIARAVESAHRNGIIMDLFTADGYYAESESWVTQIRRDYFKVEPTLADFSRLPQNIVIIKGTLVVRTPEEKAGAERFRREFQDILHLSLTKTPAYPDIDFYNVLSPGVSKKTALEALLKHLDISADQVMSIGDGLNDVPIITAAGLGVAMGNAIPEVKAVARYITDDVDHDGVAKAINKFVLDQDA
jgi:5-amino-6-(5-phospho-D-ribitylamino)uracil phosphatase